MGHDDLVRKVRLPVRDRRGQILARLDDVTLLGVDADDDLKPFPRQMVEQLVVPKRRALRPRRQVA